MLKLRLETVWTPVRSSAYSLNLQMTLDAMKEKDSCLPGTQAGLLVKPRHLTVPLGKQPSFSVLSFCLYEMGIIQTPP